MKTNGKTNVWTENIQSFYEIRNRIKSVGFQFSLPEIAFIGWTKQKKFNKPKVENNLLD